MTLRELRRLERVGLDDDGLDVYASETYEERRARRQERVRFADWYARVPGLLAVLDALTAWGEPETKTRMRAWLDSEPPGFRSTSAGPSVSAVPMRTYARAYASFSLSSLSSLSFEGREGRREEENEASASGGCA